jgi:hypothetical protein
MRPITWRLIAIRKLSAAVRSYGYVGSWEVCHRRLEIVPMCDGPIGRLNLTLRNHVVPAQLTHTIAPNL